MTDILDSVLKRGDLAHLALFLWAAGASFLLLQTIRELLRLSARFDGFIAELARFNERMTAPD